MTDGITPAEHRVLALLGRGMTNRQIAAAAGATEGSVKSHVSRLLLKLGCGNRVQLALLAGATVAACGHCGRKGAS